MAFVQTIVRLTLLGSMSLVPVIVGLVSARTVDLGPVTIDGTRVVMFAGGLIAAAVGMLAYRQMDDRRTEPLLPDLLAALRRGEPRDGTGMLIAVEGIDAGETAEQATAAGGAAAERGPSGVVLSRRGGAARRARALRRRVALRRRAHARWPAAAIRADLVERVVRPALDDGALVVADRFLASPLVQFGVVADRTRPSWIGSELESLAVVGDRPAAAGRVGAARPCADPSLAEAAVPAGDDTAPIPLPGEEHLRVRRLLTRMAAAEPHRYVVVDADGTPDEVAVRVLAAAHPGAAGIARCRRGGLDGTTAVQHPADAPRCPAPSDAPLPPSARPLPAAAANRRQPRGRGAVTTVVDDGEIATSGAKPAQPRFLAPGRRS